MQTTRCISLIVLGCTLAVTSTPAATQVLIATIPVGMGPSQVAVNPATNKIYVANRGNGTGNTVTAIDGATLSTDTVTVSTVPWGVAANSVTNKIYVTNSDVNGKVTVIDGTTENTSTITVGHYPTDVAINPATNKIYVSEAGDAAVTVIDGVTNDITTVSIGSQPDNGGLAVNPLTNKIYVAYQGGIAVIDGATNSVTPISFFGVPSNMAVNTATNKIYVSNYPNTVVVVDGATNHVAMVDVGSVPEGIAVNSVTNKIYVANNFSNDVTVIDGATNSTTTVAVGSLPGPVALDPVVNRVYVVNNGSDSVTVIDGTTNSTLQVTVGTDPAAVAVDSATNRIYVANQGDDTVSVITAALQFIAVTPCEFGGPPIQGGTFRNFPIPDNLNCGIPNAAGAYSLNVTVVPHEPLGYLTIWPAGQPQPLVSTLNSLDGRVKANAAIVPAGDNGAVSVFASNTTDVVLDIDGYFTPAGNSTLTFYPLSPCRVADTRNPNGWLGGPYLQGGHDRVFPILDATSCSIPSAAQAYSLNVTALPRGTLGYLTVWPAGQARPQVSTLNAPTGAVTANAAIVVGGDGGDISVYPTNDIDLVIDIDGYFAARGQGGLSLFALAPCRVLDTRSGNGAFNGTLSPPVDVLGSPCGVPSQAQAYVLNATVVPSGLLGYLTLWPDGTGQPVVSTLNAYDGAVSSNMAMVPAGTGGKVDAYADGLTQLILDISAYFAP